MTLFARIRFLPITIFVATLLLTVKIGDIWNGMFGSPLRVAEAVAQQAETPPKPAANAQPKNGGSTPESSKKVAKKAGKGTEQVSKLITDDPTLLTPQEIDLLQQLAERRRKLDAQQREVESRQGLLKAAEARINRKIGELKKLQGEIEDRIKVFDEQQDKKIESLVKIYENMKPKDAARIFEDLELDTLLEVAERMKERKLAPIMARMNPEKAREVTVELRALRDLPRGARGGRS